MEVKRLIIDCDERTYRKFKIIKDVVGLNNSETLSLLMEVFEKTIDDEKKLDDLVNIIYKIKEGGS